MNDKLPTLEGARSRSLRERGYWALIGVLLASIVWLMVGNFWWSGHSQQTTAVEAVPSTPGPAEGGAEPTDPMDGMAHSGEPSPAGTSPSEEPTGNGGVDTAAADLLSACHAVYDAQGQPLQDADAAMAQWEVHVGAMNKLVVGAITLSQATQFWNQTRVGAVAHLQAFATSDAPYRSRTLRCPPPAGRQPSGDLLDACERGVAARNRVLRLGRAALVTWRHHVMHMEMLREGRMTPARATELWLQSWREGQRQIDAYRSAQEAARGASC